MKKGTIFILFFLGLIVLSGIFINSYFKDKQENKSTYANNSNSSFKNQNNSTTTGDSESSFNQKSGNHYKDHRALSQKQKKENEREFALMREKMPDNIWIPGKLSPDEQKKRKQFTKDLIVLGGRVKRGTATREEKIKFYKLKIKETGDKIDFINYVLNRVETLKEETGEEKLSEKSIAAQRNSVEKMKKELLSYKNILAGL